MSMLNNNANPARVAKNFADKELQRAQNKAPDTMSGVFQPLIEREDPSLPSPDNIGAQAPQPASWIEGQNVQLQQERDRFSQAEANVNAMNLQAQEAQQLDDNSVTNGLGTATEDNNSLTSGDRQQILNEASTYAGADYQLGGRTAKGIDCSGLVLSVYNKLGYSLDTHLVSGIRKEIPGVRTAVENLKPGDLVVWDDDSHIAIYAGNGMIWDSSKSKGTTHRKLWGGKDQYGIAIHLPGD